MSATNQPSETALLKRVCTFICFYFCRHMNVTVIVTFLERFCSIHENGCFLEGRVGRALACEVLA